MRRLLLVGAVLFLSLNATVWAGKERVKSFPVKPGGTLEVGWMTGGSVTVEGWNRNEVEVRAMVPSSHEKMLLYSAESSRNEVRLHSSWKDENTQGRWGVNLTIRVPQRFEVVIETLGGEVSVSGITGELWATTEGGGIEIVDYRGTVDATTHGGEIWVKDSVADGAVLSYGGDVILRGVEGTLEAVTHGGNVRFTGSESRRTGKPARFESHGGNIYANTALNGVSAQSGGGSIVIGKLGGSSDLETAAGRIEVESLLGSLSAESGAGNVEIEIFDDVDGDGAPREIRLIARSGDVVVVVPKDFSFRVDAELVRDLHDGMPTIRSDFKLETRQDRLWDTENSRRHRVVRAEGSFNGGRHMLDIKAHTGEVRIIRRR